MNNFGRTTLRAAGHPGDHAGGNTVEEGSSSLMFRTGDVSERLASLPPALAKFQHLEKIARRASVLYQGTSEPWDEARQKLGMAQTRLNGLTSPLHVHTYGDGRIHSDEDDRVVAAKAEIDKATSALRRIDTEREELGNRQQIAHGTVTRVLEYLRAGVPLIQYSGPKAVLVKGLDYFDAVEQERNKRADLESALSEWMARPFKADAVIKKHVGMIERQARDGRPTNCAQTINYNDDIQWPTIEHTTFAPGERAMLVSQVDAMAVICWLFKDQLIKAVTREISAVADDARALDDKERAEGQAKFLADILTSERAEESLIEQAEARGIEILRRADADPRALLGLTGTWVQRAG